MNGVNNLLAELENVSALLDEMFTFGIIILDIFSKFAEIDHRLENNYCVYNSSVGNNNHADAPRDGSSGVAHRTRVKRVAVCRDYCYCHSKISLFISFLTKPLYSIFFPRLIKHVGCCKYYGRIKTLRYAECSKK